MAAFPMRVACRAPHHSGRSAPTRASWKSAHWCTEEPMRIGNAGSRGGPVGADLGVMCDWSRHSEGRASKLGGRSDEWKGHRGDSLDDSSTDTVRCVNGLRTHGAQDRRAPTALGSRVAAVGSLLLLLASLLAGCGDPQPDNGTLVAAVAADR